jgi:cytidine deaminase
MDKEQQELFSAAQSVLKNSYSPYSNYQVGASVLSESGKIYTGTNIENVSYGLTICAESAAIAQMVSMGDKQIKSLLVMANHDSMCTPCGACRQRIAEFSTSKTKIHMCNVNKVQKTTELHDLLPYTFNNENIER